MEGTPCSCLGEKLEINVKEEAFFFFYINEQPASESHLKKKKEKREKHSPCFFFLLFLDLYKHFLNFTGDSDMPKQTYLFLVYEILPIGYCFFLVFLLWPGLEPGTAAVSSNDSSH